MNISYKDFKPKNHAAILAIELLPDNMSFITEYKNVIKPLLDNPNTANALANIKHYDINTFNHSVSVAIVSGVICKLCSLSSKEFKNAIIAGLFHDIGKIMVDKHIILGNTKLSEKERFVIQLHPLLGYNVCSKLQLPHYVKRGVLMHHENYDGTGYPFNKKKDEIPLIARILRLADVFDALISKRSYKKEYDYDSTIKYILSNSGNLFDPKLLNVFRKVA